MVLYNYLIICFYNYLRNLIYLNVDIVKIPFSAYPIAENSQLVV